jgi:hypothetical protein
MKMYRNPGLRVLSTLALIALVAALPVHAQKTSTPPDSTLYTTYSGTPTSVSWIVCGSTEESEGCYGSGKLGPFAGVGAILEGNPSVSGDVVTRAIYIVDSGDESDVQLYVYKKTDTVTSSSDTVDVTLAKTISLPLTGGTKVLTYMAANAKYLFIGTSLSTQGIRVTKSNLAVTLLGGFSPPIDVTSITVDEYGYVAVTQAGGFSLYGPDGGEEEDGGGTSFTVGTAQSLPASVLLNGDPRPARQLGYKMKSAPPAAN